MLVWRLSSSSSVGNYVSVSSVRVGEREGLTVVVAVALSKQEHAVETAVGFSVHTEVYESDISLLPGSARMLDVYVSSLRCGPS